MLDADALRVRLTGVRDRIARAAGRAGRDPATITLVAVSKTFSTDHVRAATQAGQIHFGENKVQEGLPKMAQTADLPLRWHLVGHLQSNKARKAASHFDVIHSVDEGALLKKLDDAAAAAGRELDVLIQVDLAREPTKHGTPPELVPEIVAVARDCRAARLTGLMVLPPAVPDAELARPYFKVLRQLRDDLLVGGVQPEMLRELSMGMSHDFEVAIEEGATMVRVGSAIFGSRE